MTNFSANSNTIVDEVLAPANPDGQSSYYALQVIHSGMIIPYELKKCCKKYKNGKRCKKCPNN